MKKSILVFALLAAGAVLFAEGAQDIPTENTPQVEENEMVRMRGVQENRVGTRPETQPENRPEARRGGPMDQEVFEEAAEITVEGQLVQEYGHYLLNTGSAEYQLMIPGIHLLDLDIEAGDSVSITGKLADAELLPDFVGSGDGVILVESGEMDGETYEVENDFMEGFRAGQMASRAQQENFGGREMSRPQNNRSRR